MLKIILIRHGKTYGNTKGRYIGSRTDEPLCREGRESLQKRKYPKAELVYVSPMKRCMETAQCIYPGISMESNAFLKECDFGLFENKSYEELSDCPEYQAWIDSNGTLPFPKGESQESFKKRCSRGFAQCVEQALQRGIQQAAMVVHGGTIMSILCAFASPRGAYFQWQIGNGEYYELTIEEEVWKKEQAVSLVKKGTFGND